MSRRRDPARGSTPARRRASDCSPSSMTQLPVRPSRSALASSPCVSASATRPEHSSASACFDSLTSRTTLKAPTTRPDASRTADTLAVRSKRLRSRRMPTDSIRSTSSPRPTACSVLSASPARSDGTISDSRCPTTASAAKPYIRSAPAFQRQDGPVERRAHDRVVGRLDDRRVPLRDRSRRTGSWRPRSATATKPPRDRRTRIAHRSASRCPSRSSATPPETLHKRGSPPLRHPRVGS